MTRKTFNKKYTKIGPIWGIFLIVSGIFVDFFCRPPKRLVLRLFAISGPEGPETPVNARSGRNPNPETRKKTKKLSSPGPDPNSQNKTQQNKLKLPEKYFFEGIFRFSEFFQGVWGRGRGGYLFSFFEEFRGSGFSFPVAGRALRKTDFLPLLALTRWARSTGKNQYW